jgi:hypothetical protein
MSDDEYEGEDWEQPEDLLYEANNLNASVKHYLMTDGNSSEYLRRLEMDLAKYLSKISGEGFNDSGRSDGISKEGVVNDLRLNLEAIKKRLSTGGKRRRNNKHRKTKRTRRNSRRTKRNIKRSRRNSRKR